MSNGSSVGARALWSAHPALYFKRHGASKPTPAVFVDAAVAGYLNWVGLFLKCRIGDNCVDLSTVWNFFGACSIRELWLLGRSHGRYRWLYILRGIQHTWCWEG
jgi:hypothetical protein